MQSSLPLPPVYISLLFSISFFPFFIIPCPSFHSRHTSLFSFPALKFLPFVCGSQSRSRNLAAIFPPGNKSMSILTNRFSSFLPSCLFPSLVFFPSRQTAFSRHFFLLSIFSVGFFPVYGGNTDVANIWEKTH